MAYEMKYATKEEELKCQNNVKTAFWRSIGYMCYRCFELFNLSTASAKNI